MHINKTYITTMSEKGCLRSCTAKKTCQARVVAVKKKAVDKCNKLRKITVCEKVIKTFADGLLLP